MACGSLGLARLEAWGFFGIGRADEFNHNFMTDLEFATPILADVAKHPMLMLIPFTGSR